jgi:hypothetical protein
MPSQNKLMNLIIALCEDLDDMGKESFVLLSEHMRQMQSRRRTMGSCVYWKYIQILIRLATDATLKSVLLLTEHLGVRRSLRIWLIFLMIGFLISCSLKKSTMEAYLAWRDNSTDESGFRIYRIVADHEEKIAEVGVNITRFIDTGASPKACYVVVAFNAAGESSPSNKACLSE